MTLSVNILTELSPKETILKYVFSGNDLKNKIKASLALLILSPCIDPLLSKKKIYSPFVALISVYNYFFDNDAFIASSTLNSQNLGIKDNITVELTSVRPRTKFGRWKSYVVYKKCKSVFGSYYWAKTRII